MATAFADPAKYDLYDCKQLETERKGLAKRAAELQGLMAKADTGAAGPVVAELAYRNDYVAVRGQAKFAEEAWQRNKCHAVAAGRRRADCARCCLGQCCQGCAARQGCAASRHVRAALFISEMSPEQILPDGQISSSRIGRCPAPFAKIF